VKKYSFDLDQEDR